MLGAGLIKLRGDAGWRDLSILRYFFETQPIPNPLSRWFHFLPAHVLQGGVLWNHLAELAAPLLLPWPHRRVRLAGGVIIILFQFSIILSGNLSFLNWLTVVPALACIDDVAWKRVLPTFLVRRATRAAADAVPSRPQQVTAWVLAALITVLSIRPAMNLLSAGQIMNTSFDPLELVNTYGAFGTVGQHRYDVIFEGTDAADPQAPDVAWKPYPYKGLPTDVHRSPVADRALPVASRLADVVRRDERRAGVSLDAASRLETPAQRPGRRSASSPPIRSPTNRRATFAPSSTKYRFAPPGNPDGVWWTRSKQGLWLPPFASDNPELTQFLQQEGWLPPIQP